MPGARACVFYLGLVLSTLVATPITFILLAVPYPARFRLASNWARFNLWWLRITCGVTAEITGREHIPDRPAIIVSKHQSAWETLAIQLLFPPQAWILKRELLWIPVYGWGLATMRPIAIDRARGTRALRQVVRQGSAALQAGLWVVIFPEGTRSAPGERKKYHPGGGLLAEKSGCPVVPIAHNAGCFWPRNSFRKRPGAVRMVIGPAISPRGKKAGAINREAEEWIEDTVAALPGIPPDPDD